MLQIIYGTHMKLKFKLKNKQKHRSKLRKGQRLKTHYEALLGDAAEVH
jgi:hypothetical protein